MKKNMDLFLRLLLATNTVNFTASLTSLMAVAIDRFWAICYPISYRHKNTDRVTNSIIASFWTFSLSIGLITFLTSSKSSKPGDLLQIGETLFTDNGTLLFYHIYVVITCSVMILLYTCMYRELSKQVRT